MRTLVRSMLATLIVAPSVLAAQAAATATVFQVTPYAGVMVFGNLLNGPMGTSLTNKPGMLYGAQIGMALSPELSLVGNLGYTTSNLDVGLPIVGGISVGHSSTLLYDADLELRLGSIENGTSTIKPFVQGGVGAMRYEIEAASILTTTATNFAGNVGLGADVSVGRGVAVRVLARDYIGKFNFRDAVGFDVEGSTTHNIGLTAGLRFDF